MVRITFVTCSQHPLKIFSKDPHIFNSHSSLYVGGLMDKRLLNALLLANEIFDDATHEQLLIIANAILKAFDTMKKEEISKAH